MKADGRLFVTENPSVEAACQTVRKALGQHKCVLVVGDCSVEYHGRARSVLESGERILLIKSDGAVLVHRPTGSRPVNWQPSGCILKTTERDRLLVIEAARRTPAESLAVCFTKVEVIVAAALTDAGEFHLHLSEEELQRAVLAEPGLLLPDLRPVAYEKKVEPGFIDVYGLDSCSRLVVAELKRGRAGRAAVLQLARYVESVRQSTPLVVRGILAAPTLAKGAHTMLAQLGLEFVRVDLERCARSISPARDKKMAEFLK
jgi:RecB family endonuclease NucS